MASSPPRAGIALHLALQGGGAHGAFTWGVLERLLEEEHLTIARISGTSAGALNGAALATGLALGGRQGAREHLALLWQKVAEAGSLLTWLMLPLRKPGLGIWDDVQPLVSPYLANPLDMAPLRSALAPVVDLALLRAAAAAPPLFVNAVHVQSGRSRIFGPADLSLDALLASACTPFSYRAVQIDGESWWDGSYALNPALLPLYHDGPDCDLLLVELTPLRRAETPLSAKNILNRLNEIASVQGLVADLRALQDFRRGAAGRHIRLHVLGMGDRPQAVLEDEPSIKRTVSSVLFQALRSDGHAACDAWLRRHGAALGKRSTVDVEARYLAPFTPRLEWEG